MISVIIIVVVIVVIAIMIAIIIIIACGHAVDFGGKCVDLGVDIG